ncbi:MAG TPA: 2-dehydro-3-deoxygalactonokinase [Puia sp.]|jgi:2-dehydro-3-deoxygalactonokinase|nr:2-dehydro-3-deoxygalactonokinase [Puia sp.]
MNLLISCDWGTTNFRLRLVDSDRREAIGEVHGPDGVAAVYSRWRAAGQGAKERLGFYRAVMAKEIEHLRRHTTYSLTGLPVVLSGMAASSMGMVELPYRSVPMVLTGEDLIRVAIPPSDGFGHSILMVSGVRTKDDVMRGEETQLVGCAAAGNDERLYIFPGTHSKHVRVRAGRAVDITTFMTGECFQLLATKSILSVSVSAASSDGGAVSDDFMEGIRDSRKGGILHTAFKVRIRQLLAGLSRESNYQYLSGLMIGEELKVLEGTEIPIIIVGAGRMKEYYAAACEELGCPEVCVTDADQALVRGHCRVLEFGQGGIS